jgi:transcription initiation factor IIE alpha subunit
MTREHRLVLSLDELQAVRWTCPRCHVALVFQLNETIALPSTCPSCNDPLMDQEKATKTAQVFVQALKALRHGPSLLQLDVLDDDPR